MTDTETAALTQEVIALHNEVTEFGRKSVSLIVQCGKKLTEIQNGLPKGKWMQWQQEHGDVMSKSTINRYKRVYELSLVTSFDGKTLTEVYQAIKSTKKAPKQPSCTGEPADDESETSTPLKALDALVTAIIDTISRIDESEKVAALEKLKAIVEFYNDRMELRVAA